MPLLFLSVGMVTIVVIACLIAFGHEGAVETWKFLDIVDVPLRSKPRILAASFVSLAVALLAYLSYLSRIVAALRRNGLRLAEFMDLPAEKRRALLSATSKTTGSRGDGQS